MSRISCLDRQQKHARAGDHDPRQLGNLRQLLMDQAADDRDQRNVQTGDESGFRR